MNIQMEVVLKERVSESWEADPSVPFLPPAIHQWTAEDVIPRFEPFFE